MSSDNTIQTITMQNSPSYVSDWEKMVEFVQENLPSYIEQHPEQFDKFFDNIIQKVQDENRHHPCLSIDLGQEYDENDQPKHPNLKQVYEKFTPKAKHPYVISFLIEDKEGVRTATLQHILHGKQIQHLTKECTRRWILLKEFVNRNTTRNKTMKRRSNEEISYGLGDEYLGIPETKYSPRKWNSNPTISYNGKTFSEDEIWKMCVKLYQNEVGKYPKNYFVLQQWLQENPARMDEILNQLDACSRKINESDIKDANILVHIDNALSLLDSLPRIYNGQIGSTEFQYVVKENGVDSLSTTLSKVRSELSRLF